MAVQLKACGSINKEGRGKKGTVMPGKPFLSKKSIVMYTSSPQDARHTDRVTVTVVPTRKIAFLQSELVASSQCSSALWKKGWVT